MTNLRQFSHSVSYLDMRLYKNHDSDQLTPINILIYSFQIVVFTLTNFSVFFTHVHPLFNTDNMKFVYRGHSSNHSSLQFKNTYT